ncbi:hypothetical protein DUI87_26862 [Hirundo rustica rustica]|uniref:Uncharacterized protein n=1 Tax=Hirundo rustica rustica TaxID=333673 RepID=A0A3M0JPQ1_HIRRU|nr:hypothetical protein DUI87_26862 [Hirundo rustica rustica]
MSFIRLHRLSVLWKNWMFNQEPEHVFQVENSKDNEENILQREVPLRQSRRRYRKINQRGERQTITDNVDSSSYISVGSQLSGAQEQPCAQVPEDVPEPLLARHPVRDRTLEERTFAVRLQLFGTPAILYVFLASVIKRSGICSIFTSCVGPCGFGLSWAAHKGRVGADPALSAGGEEMYMDGALCFLERKITVRLGFGGGGRGCESGCG